MHRAGIGLRQPRPRLRRLRRRATSARLNGTAAPNIAIVSAYNDMLSAHQPFERFPAMIKRAVREAGGDRPIRRRRAGDVRRRDPGPAGMEFSLFCRDVIAHGAAVALSPRRLRRRADARRLRQDRAGSPHRRLAFGHLPSIFVPAGPMPCGLSNPRRPRSASSTPKARSAASELLDAEAQSYHGPGTCTFYGTANSNQMLMEMMGLHLPGAAFVNPNTPLRDALTAAAAQRIGDHGAGQRLSPRSAASSTSARSSTAWSDCSPPGARPTTRSTWWRWRTRRDRVDLAGFRRPLGA